MPPAKKPASRASRAANIAKASRPSVPFREPAALKRLGKSIDAAHDALAALRASAPSGHTRDVRALHKDLRTVLESARSSAGKLTSTLQTEFDQAQKRLASTRPSPSGVKKGAQRATKEATKVAGKAASKATSRATGKSTAKKAPAKAATAGSTRGAAAARKPKSTAASRTRTSAAAKAKTGKTPV
jgi:hypothetical protein